MNSRAFPIRPAPTHFIRAAHRTIRREFLDHTLFWNAVDLERKLGIVSRITTIIRVHMRRWTANTPDEISGDNSHATCSTTQLRVEKALRRSVPTPGCSLSYNSPCTGSSKLNSRRRCGPLTRSELHSLKSRIALAVKRLRMWLMPRSPTHSLGWYRRLIARKFDGSKSRRYPGRPRIDDEIEQRVVRMAKENSDWGQ